MWRVLILLALPTATMADSLVATRVIKAQTTILAEDLTLVAAEIPGALTNPDAAIGKEARVAIYPGRPVLQGNLVTAALVDRNQLVSLIYIADGLAIRTEGRALARGGEGDFIEVMNLASRTKITGRVASDGSILVGSGITQ
jgi:flagella basal body P-ring formation protein FlgA